MNTYPVTVRKRPVFTKCILLLAGVLCLLPACIFAFRRPAYNWDMLPYMALTLKVTNSTENFDLLHKATYDIAREKIPAGDYGNLTTGAYREKMAADPEAFYAQLPFYAVKPLYIGIICLFYKAGISLPIATWLPAILSYLLIGILLFCWIRKYFKPLPAFLSGLLIMYSPIMIGMARLSTPDGLSSLLLLSTFYLIIEKPSVTGMFFLFIISLCARLDNIVTCFIILSFLFFKHKWKMELTLRQYMLMTAALAICYFLVTWLTVAPFGWGLLYYPAFADHFSLSHRYLSSFSFSEYAALLYSQAITAVIYHHFTLFTFLALVAAFPFFSKCSDAKPEFDQQFAILLIFIILVRFIIHPNLDDRFYVSSYLLILMMLVKRVSLLHPGWV